MIRIACALVIKINLIAQDGGGDPRRFTAEAATVTATLGDDDWWTQVANGDQSKVAALSPSLSSRPKFRAIWLWKMNPNMQSPLDPNR